LLRKFRERIFSCFFLCFLLSISHLPAQDQRIADSLAQIYKQNTLTDTAKFQLLLDLSYNEIGDLHKAVKYAEELITGAQRAENNRYLRSGYFLKGTKERLLGNLDAALDAFFKSAELAKKMHNLLGEGDSYGAIADTYAVGNNPANAQLYYRQAINILRIANDSGHLASFLSNAGDQFLRIKNYDSALFLFYGV
jgi:tetratricopeptide (TPR) repeat protein